MVMHWLMAAQGVVILELRVDSALDASLKIPSDGEAASCQGCCRGARTVAKGEDNKR